MPRSTLNSGALHSPFPALAKKRWSRRQRSCGLISQGSSVRARASMFANFHLPSAASNVRTRRAMQRAEVRERERETERERQRERERERYRIRPLSTRKETGNLFRLQPSAPGCADGVGLSAINGHSGAGAPTACPAATAQQRIFRVR